MIATGLLLLRSQSRRGPSPQLGDWKLFRWANTTEYALPDQHCRNTKQGAVYITDERGYTCHRNRVRGTGCCPRAEQEEGWGRYSCAGCSEAARCCNDYELCVSCCMNPNNRQLLESVMMDMQEQPSSSDQFELCMELCRTSSKTIHNEREFKSSFRHCFGLNGPP
eukprot:TRINITY_DN15970_c0_g1_i1.p1 TRINITY_DN15970_c0_g1~~TRINITY_DN15970_c0_g1_i1.p1  ORF type:complete len:193 (-),score=16.67 TRINITY_DN15970_c0_g1_i1:157-654(-)